MFTDIVGYTAMMGQNETQALSVVSMYEDVIQKTTLTRSGELIHFYGDGSLSVFDDVNSALHCATDIQRHFVQHEVPLRVGIHHGEAIFQKGNAYGDAVNLASRIESMGQAGAVLFSEEIDQHINKELFNSNLLGSFEFKNVKKPMKVFALDAEGLNLPDPEKLSGKFKNESEGMSIAVIPFKNTGGKPEHDYIVDGICDEIRSQLLGIEGLKVISRSSSQYFKDRSYSLKDILQELKVHYVLEGRVMIVDNEIRVNVDLSSTHTDKQLWSLPASNQSLAELFELQNNVAIAVANELRVMLTDDEKDLIKKSGTTNENALISYQKGMEMLHRGHGNIQELNEALGYFRKAIKEDPKFSKAYIGIADAYLEHLFWGRGKVSEVIEHANEAANRALEISGPSGECYGSLGAIQLFGRANVKLAREYLQKSIEMSPSHLWAYEKMGWAMLFDDDMEGSLKMFRKSQELDPLSTKYIGDLGHAYYYSGFFKEGIEYLKPHLEEHPNDPWILWMMAYLLSGNGQYEEAAQHLLMRETQGKRSNWMLGYLYGKMGKFDDAQVILDFHLNKYKLDFVPPYMIATIYSGLDDKENAIKWLELDREDGGQGLFYMGLKTDPKFQQWADDPRFQALLL